MSLATIDEALKRIRRGEMVLVVDDEDRENEGDLTMGACWVTPEAVNFMLTHARGVICVVLPGEVCDRLHLHNQTQTNTAQLGTAFTVTVDAHPKFGVTTGVSASDRAKTIAVAIADSPAGSGDPSDIFRPIKRIGCDERFNFPDA